jgi:hypothetical protein
MLDASCFANTRLVGGYIIVSLSLISEPLIDPIGRTALARTQIVGRQFYMTMVAEMDDRECSISLYHEVLEAMTVACPRTPASVMEMNEADFERAAHDAHQHFGLATPDSLNRMLQSFGFTEE